MAPHLCSSESTSDHITTINPGYPSIFGNVENSPARLLHHTISPLCTSVPDDPPVVPTSPISPTDLPPRQTEQTDRPENLARDLTLLSHSCARAPMFSPPASEEQLSMADAAVAPGSGLGSHRKPLRLSLACNQCRKRKVRCDARQPKCRNCTLRDEHCETSDPRRPGTAPAVRRRAAGRRSSTPEDGGSDQVVLSPGAGVDERASPPAAVLLPPPASGSYLSSATAPPVFAPSPASSARTRAQSQSSRSRGLGESPRELRSVASNTARRGSHTTASTTQHEARRPIERLGANDVSWVLRAFQESTAVRVQQTGQRPQEADVVTPDVVVNTDGSPNRMKVLGGSSLQCLFNFVDLFLASYGFDLTAPLFKHGMSHSEDFHMPLIPSLPNLPERPILKTYVDAFFARVWPLYPAIDRRAVDSDIDTLLELQGPDPRARLQDRVQRAHVPGLAIVYAIICIGMNETAECDSLEAREEYLTAAYSLHGHLTANPYFASVQGLFLLALALRAHTKDGQAWHIIGLAVRIATSLGLHKPEARHAMTRHQQNTTSAPSSPPHTESLRSRLWWSLFCLERLTTLECGRPSAIDPEFDRMAESYLETARAFSEDDTSPDSTFLYFAAWVALAGIMGRISDQLYSQRFCGSGHMLGETARLDQVLSEWTTSLPDHIRPRNTVANHGEDDQVPGVFLAQQYYHAQIAVLRASIIFPEKSFGVEVKNRSEADPRISRLLGAASACVHAARSLIMQTLQLADGGIRSTLIGIHQTFLATVVLALSILRQPGSRLARSDVELLASATEHVAACYRASGFNSAFVGILSQLGSRVTAVFRHAVSGTPVLENGDARRRLRNTETEAYHVDPACQPQNLSGLSLLLSAGLADTNQAMANTRTVEDLGMMGEPGMEVFNGLEFEELWNMMDADMFMYDTGDQFMMP
ncbi:fungal-specific transcription factor domain-containing protein [Plectosphaerella plurivora]|uniref:Fungal-specific transcription factor domain-containing protein n=1 Tax=Plectosphaerella plurivora TaxID=936078 RepID=A0A9P8VL29_9PEZI|nr:fungal-specific transcription factor domain-containing protein [Plectosphaerella plurivora]